MVSSVYDRLGIVPLINAKGPATRLSGGYMAPEVLDAMREAAGSCVDILALQAAASRVIARHTGAEAGLVTSGAAAALLAGTAACLTGLDPALMARLPDTRGMRNRCVMVRSQRNQYDHAVRAAGARIVEVGLADRYAGSGCRDAEPWEIDAAIGADTALVHYVADAASRPALAAVVEVAHARGIPVLVDAAAQLPPRENLTRFVAEGADLVAYSGGKAIGGPQASGILCGRRELIMAAALQMLDMDYPEGLFTPPADFIDTAKLRGLPPHGIVRPCKAGKEEIVGLLTALECFAREDPSAMFRTCRAILECVESGVDDLPGVEPALRVDGAVPQLVLSFTGAARLTARDTLLGLAGGTPSIQVDPEEIGAGRLVIAPLCLQPCDVAPIVKRLRELLGPR